MPVKRKRNRKRRTAHAIPWPAINWSRIVSVTGALIVVATGYVGTLWLMDRPIERVVINGEFERVSAIQLEQLLVPHLAAGFLSADLHAMRTDLVEVPWVVRASVRRRWPGTIEVNITEQKPAAVWSDTGLLNIDGELFVAKASHVPAELPRLYGPEGSEQRVSQMYFRIEERLEQRGLAAVALYLDNRGAWEMQLLNGIRVRIGSRAVEQRINGFFKALDSVISAQTEHIDYVDMRYTNGFAIGWKHREELRPNV